MEEFRHFTLSGTRNQHEYTHAGGGGGPKNPPPRPERRTHASCLLNGLQQAQEKAKELLLQEPAREGVEYFPVVFGEHAYFKLDQKALDNLEKTSPGARVISAKERNGTKEYLVAIPEGEASDFERKFLQYQEEDTAGGKPRHEALASAIAAIKAAELETYWTGSSDVLPDKNITLWWEVWLDTSNTDINAEEWFRNMALNQGLFLSNQKMEFPERVVILGEATFEQWRNFPGLLKHLAELRVANIVTGEFTSLEAPEQVEFIDDLLSRTNFARENATRVCILDTGVERGHLLLQDSLSTQDVQAWNDDWGTYDHKGHGTEMAGVCLFGPLTEPLYSTEKVTLLHRLESVKIFPRGDDNAPPDYAPITIGSMALAESASPEPSRVFCMAVTTSGDDQWRPTLWSAALDQAASGVNDNHRRLIVLAAGNLRGDSIGDNYPSENHLSSVEDPAQAWNALTVGGYTNLSRTQEEVLEGFSPVALAGTLSPSSRTSLCWGDGAWPYKPDVVFEGGNLAVDGSGFITNPEDMQVLTTCASINSDKPLGTICDTSAATAQAARMAAILQAEYPEYWPETIRGLIVHSAEWTNQMIEEFPHAKRKNRLRVYGMGVPNIARARRSARGFATMVIQDELQPFDFQTPSNSNTKDMNVHDLPIPREALQALGDTEIRMRVTLSYFIEPNPPRRGYVAHYQYASHGLRFSVRRPQETPESMLPRLSRNHWPTDASGRSVRPPSGANAQDDRKWDLGPEAVAIRGSMHSDCWTGTAAQLASSNLIAVHPVNGWWRYRSDQETVESKARYSLIVSISTDDTEVDLRAMIENEIAVRSQTEVDLPTEIII